MLPTKRKREDDPDGAGSGEAKRPEAASGVRQLITDDSLTTTTLQNISVELTCPVCLGIIRNAMTVMECVHRFCEACITKCLRLGKKECPSCRVKCVSRRSLRKDPNFDAVIRKIYPQLEEYEAEQDAMIEKDNATNAVNRHEQSTAAAKNAAKRIQVQLRKGRHQLSRGGGAAGGGTRGGGGRGGGAKASVVSRGVKPPRRDLQPIVESDVEFAFTLRRHPLEEQLQCLVKEYLKTSRFLTVLHLQKFLSMKIACTNSHTSILLTICTPVDNGVMPDPLDPNLTLEAIYKEMTAFRKHPILYYYCKSSLKSLKHTV